MKELLSKSDLQNINKRLAKEIELEHGDDVPIFIGVLTGSFIFLADLIRECDFRLEVDFCRVQSYKNNVKTGIELTAKWNIKLKDRVVILVDDILETGDTLSNLIKLIEWEKPKEIKTCVLLKRKDCKRQSDYVGYELQGKEWVFGMGLDDNGLKRDLSGIWIK